MFLIVFIYMIPLLILKSRLF